MTDLDEALERFALTDFEYAGGLANHGPMAAEALTVLGHGALTQGWVDVYAPRLAARKRGTPIAASEQPEALGRPERLPDWAATFEAELAQLGWRELADVWLQRLLPGAFAGAGHGLLRVAHALRALAAEDTAPRRRELALGLAYWPGRLQRLPGLPGASPREGCGPQQAFEGLAVERLAAELAEIRYRAACSLEEHAIKFSEACLRENAIEPAPVFALAAADAAIHLDSGAGRGAAC